MRMYEIKNYKKSLSVIDSERKVIKFSKKYEYVSTNNYIIEVLAELDDNFSIKDVEFIRFCGKMFLLSKYELKLK